MPAPAAPAAPTPGVISNTAPMAKPTHEELATIERDGCYGWCPVYKLTVFRDGTVEYTGERFVKTTGVATWTLTQTEVAAIDALFAETHYGELLDKYLSYDVTDGPPTTRHAQRRGPQGTNTTAAISRRPGARARRGGLDKLVHIEKHIGTEAEREKLAGPGLDVQIGASVSVAFSGHADDAERTPGTPRDSACTRSTCECA